MIDPRKAPKLEMKVVKLAELDPHEGVTIDMDAIWKTMREARDRVTDPKSCETLDASLDALEGIMMGEETTPKRKREKRENPLLGSKVKSIFDDDDDEENDPAPLPTKKEKFVMPDKVGFTEATPLERIRAICKVIDEQVRRAENDFDDDDDWTEVQSLVLRHNKENIDLLRKFVLGEKPHAGEDATIAAGFIAKMKGRKLDLKHEKHINAMEKLKRTRGDDHGPLIPKDFVVTCVDNNGLENKFDVGVEYMARRDVDPEMWQVYDRFGEKRTCLRERFREKTDDAGV